MNLCTSRYPLMVEDGLLQKKLNRKPRSHVTVCIAAICNNNAIWGASDRMLTSGDGTVEFEPFTPKSVSITNYIAAMMAGDSGIQAEILQEICGAVQTRILAEPLKWLKVKHVADLWADTYHEIKNKNAERRVLSPLGLTRKTFVENQKFLTQESINSVTKEMLNYGMPEFDTIITGLDSDGPHIYVVGNYSVDCFDMAGFAAVGVGARHAISQFMHAKHGRGSTLDEAILLTYSSKKFSEVAPGVGQATDMFGIGPSMLIDGEKAKGTEFFLVPDSVLQELDKMHWRRVKREQEAMKRAIKEVYEYTQKLRQTRSKADEGQQIKDVTGKPTPPDGTSVSDDPKKS